MALKGEAKKLYQREYMRDYMRRKRVKTSDPVLRPNDDVRPTFVVPIPKPTKKKMGRAIWLR